MSALNGVGVLSSHISLNKDGRFNFYTLGNMGVVTAPLHSKGLEIGRSIIGAVSGFDRFGDEAIALTIWMIFRWITRDEAREIANASGNNALLKSLLEACQDLCDREIYPE